MITPYKHPIVAGIPSREDFFNLVDVMSTDMNETLNQILNSKAVDNSWKCFEGPINVYTSSRDDKNLFIGCSTRVIKIPEIEGHRIYNGSEVELIVEIAVVHAVSLSAIRWVNPNVKELFFQECREKGIDTTKAVGSMTYQDFDRFNAFKEAALLIFQR